MDASLLDSAAPQRPILWARGAAISTARMLEHVERLVEALPPGTHLVNLCERRDAFLIAYCAALARGHTSLMPPSRAPQAVSEVEALYPGSYRCDDDSVDRAIESEGRTAYGRRPPNARLCVSGGHAAQIAFTSGSTGAPRAHVKRWSELLGSTRFNADRIRECLTPRYGAARPWIVATVPPQHMYGTETTILLPIVADMAVHAARPLFPADVAAVLAQLPEPRVLVTTPVHLRALVGSGQRFPEVGVVLSATAPLDRKLALSAEQALGTTVLEMFGSTETCVIATRLTAHEHSWRPYPGVSLVPRSDGTDVDAPWFDAPTRLQDLIELEPAGSFTLRGRNVDLIDVAGKRASLADLTRRLLAIEGVKDAVVFQPDAEGTGGVLRVAALVVAPGLDAETICARLARAVDSAFIPRPMVLVPALPRNDLGKLARAELIAAATAHPDWRP